MKANSALQSFDREARPRPALETIPAGTADRFGNRGDEREVHLVPWPAGAHVLRLQRPGETSPLD